MSDSPTVFILDSYALLAYLGGESGEGRVKEILHDAALEESLAFMSLINLGEVVYITERERGLAKAQEVLAIVEQLPIEIHRLIAKRCSQPHTSRRSIRSHTQTPSLLRPLKCTMELFSLAIPSSRQ